MQKIVLMIMLLSLSGCPLATIPTMTRPIKVWNGAPEVGGICRMDAKEVSEQSGLPLVILKRAMDKLAVRGCLDSTDPIFKSYACLTFADLKVIYDYTETLINQCKKWK